MTFIDTIDKKKIRTFWIATIAYMGLIFLLSSLHGMRLPKIPENSDKLIHMAVYVPLGFLLCMALVMSGLRRYGFVIALILTIIYGMTDEFHQSFVPGRHASFGDVIADSVGALLGCLGVSFIKK